MRNIQVDANKITVDGTPITVLTKDEYLANREVPTHLVILVENFLRVKRSNGNAMMQIPTNIPLTRDVVLQRLVSWFMKNEGGVNEQLEEAVRATARGGISVD